MRNAPEVVREVGVNNFRAVYMLPPLPRCSDWTSS